GQYPPGQYPPGQAPPPGQYPQTPPGQAPPPGQQPGGQVPLPAVHNDPINADNIHFLRSRAQVVIQELIAALPQNYKSRVQGIPLVVDDTVGEVNAFAACTAGGKALM